MGMDKSIAIITARGGSKRISGKNIKMFCGKPIIEYSIREAINSEQFDEVMVSTDSKEIAAITKKCGANIPFMRSKELVSDTTTTDETLMGVLNDYKKIGQQFKYMCCIYPTAPFVTADKLMSAMQLMREKNPEQIIPIVVSEMEVQDIDTEENWELAEIKYMLMQRKTI